MRGNYLRSYIRTPIPQSEPLDDTQVKNKAGGYVYEISQMDRVRRFLMMGSEGGTYYENERDLTKANVDNTIQAIKSDGVAVVQMAADISQGGKAAKNDMAIFVLALAATHGDVKTKCAIELAFNQVVRIGTHILMFCSFVDNMRGWGSWLKRLVSNWYESKTPEQLAYQTVKYRNREGWTHKDVLRKCHGGANTGLYRWIVGQDYGDRVITPRGGKQRGYECIKQVSKGEFGDFYPDIVHAFETVKAMGNMTDAKPKAVIPYIEKYNLTHEMIPTHFKNEPAVWEALLQKMPVTALLRNLGKMTSLDMFKPFSENVKFVVEKLQPDNIKKARLHPLTILGGSMTYSSGKGFRGSLTWTPNQQIMGHLEDVFYWSFDTIEPTGKNMLLALDVSSSMACNYPMAAYPMISCAEVTAVMAMATARVEPNYYICAFSDTFKEIPITAKSTLKDALSHVKYVNFGSTDCALPMVEARFKGWDVDAFAVYTDNETWSGHIHPKKALDKYRYHSNRDSRLVVAAMTSTVNSIADPNVDYMLDVCGIGTDTPRMISEFAAGRI